MSQSFVTAEAKTVSRFAAAIFKSRFKEMNLMKAEKVRKAEEDNRGEPKSENLKSSMNASERLTDLLMNPRKKKENCTFT